MRFAGEPGDAGDFDQQPGGAGGTDAVQAGQCATGGFEQVTEFFVGGLLALVDAFQVADQLGGNPAAGLAAASRGRTLASRALAWAADRSFFAPPGMSSGSKWCSWQTMRV